MRSQRKRVCTPLKCRSAWAISLVGVRLSAHHKCIFCVRIFNMRTSWAFCGFKLVRVRQMCEQVLRCMQYPFPFVPWLRGAENVVEFLNRSCAGQTLL